MWRGAPPTVRDSITVSMPPVAAPDALTSAPKPGTPVPPGSTYGLTVGVMIDLSTQFSSLYVGCCRCVLLSSSVGLTQALYNLTIIEVVNRDVVDNMPNNEDFMSLVQLHERAWGNERYAGRPTLKDILDAPVVTIWRPLKEDKQKRFTIKLHKSTEDVEQHMTKLLFRAHIKLPEERLVRVFVNHKQVVVKAVRILFQELPTD